MPVGTLVLPDPSKVLAGEGYGADGTEFTGTLVVLAPPTPTAAATVSGSGSGGFYGYRSVIASRNLHLTGTGKIRSGTLQMRGANDTLSNVAWANIYLSPQLETTGLGGRGFSSVDGPATMWRMGERYAPRVNDKLIVNGATFLVLNVTPKLNADESRNYAVYDLQLTSK